MVEAHPTNIEMAEVNMGPTDQLISSGERSSGNGIPGKKKKKDKKKKGAVKTQ